MSLLRDSFPGRPVRYQYRDGSVFEERALPVFAGSFRLDREVLLAVVFPDTIAEDPEALHEVQLCLCHGMRQDEGVVIHLEQWATAQVKRSREAVFIASLTCLSGCPPGIEPVLWEQLEHALFHVLGIRQARTYPLDHWPEPYVNLLLDQGYTSNSNFASKTLRYEPEPEPPRRRTVPRRSLRFDP